MRIFKGLGFWWAGRIDTIITTLAPDWDYFFYGFTHGQWSFGFVIRRVKKARKK